MLTYSGLQDAVWTPAKLFGPGDQGGFWDFRPEFCAQNSDGTGAAAVGQPVGWVRDLSGNGNHMVQATSAAKPVLRSGPYSVEFDGVDDELAGSFPISNGVITECAEFIVLADYGTGATNPISSSGSDTPKRINIHTGANANITADYYSNFGGRIEIAQTVPINTLYVVGHAVRSGSHELFLNGQKKAAIQVNENVQGLTTPPILGVFPTGWGRFPGKLVAAFTVCRSLSDMELSYLQHWLARRAGIAL